MSNPESLAQGVLQAERVALGRAITLVESDRPEDRKAARRLLRILLPHAGRSLRVGISGSPGVGKSTFIERFGLLLTEAGHRVAVLAVDPTSARTGGSILGDKTRMPRLAAEPHAFIRPSPSRGNLGGVTLQTRQAITVTEAAGHDVILVETVGVGQSETEVAHLVDYFLVLAMPQAGDELQGLKRGILELADAVAVNKSDLDEDAARRTAQDLRRALRYVPHPFRDAERTVVLTSGLTGSGLAELWEVIRRFHADGVQSGELEKRRREQEAAALRPAVEEELLARLRTEPGLSDRIAAGEADVRAGKATWQEAWERIVSDGEDP